MVVECLLVAIVSVVLKTYMPFCNLKVKEVVFCFPEESYSGLIPTVKNIFSGIDGKPRQTTTKTCKLVTNNYDEVDIIKLIGSF